MVISSKLTDLVIANGGTTSNVLDRADYRFMDEFLIGAPSALTGTITVEVSLDEGTTYHTLTSAGADINIAASKAVVIGAGGWDKLRLKSSGAEGGERTFEIKGIEKHE